ncbi:response regulator transcription factor [Enterococcus sp. 5H]|uniref:response regulator transcription factor n=1 Tax=Enterococcus sp. 5H TaxID=1229490 RepID=UPI00230487C6|nr:response regulator [Enterococcus sp. 5H]MDA9471017.1 response regulator receiver [Enterococcus sp. 5H]
MTDKKKIMIVDDEFYIHNGFANILPWDQLGYTISNTAANGLEALKLCEENQPDIIFTDIMMPHLDGIELTKAVTKRYPEIKVVILSSYNDLDYVKTAMINGAREYILKPSINAEIVEQILLDLCPPTKKFQLSLSHFSEKEKAEVISLREIHFDYPYFSCFLIQENNFFTINEITEFVKRFLNEPNFQIYTLPFKNCYLVLINHSLSNHTIELSTLTLPYIFFNSTNDIGWLEDQLSLAVKFYGDFHYYFSTPYFIWNSQDLIIETHQLHSEQKTINKLIKKEYFSEAIMSLQSIAEDQRPFLKSDFQNFFSSNIISLLSKMEDTLNRSIAMEKLTYLTINNQVDTQDQAAQNIVSFLKSVRQNYLNNSEDTTIQLILDYIQKHYATGINLASIAEQFHFNYNYLSRYFVTVTGQSFTDYLNDIRITAAKQLLKKTDLAISDVSAQVGYTDTSYFSKVFKKITQTSPSNYRRTARD